MVVGLAIHYFLWSVTPFPVVPARIAGALLFLLGGILAHRAHLAMQRVGTNVLPTRPTLALATDGPFRRTRNPLYIAALLVYVGVAFWVNGLVLLLLAIPMAWILQHGIVVPEERYLEAKFGDSYRSYRAAVPRWL